MLRNICPSASQISLAVGILKWSLRIRRHLDRLTAHATDLNSATSTSRHLAPAHSLLRWCFAGMAFGWHWLQLSPTSRAEEAAGHLAAVCFSAVKDLDCLHIGCNSR